MVAHRHVSVAPNAGDSCSGEGLKGMRTGAGGRGRGPGRLCYGCMSECGASLGRISCKWEEERLVIMKVYGGL